MTTALTPADVRALIPVPDDELIPLPSLFVHRSDLHGQAHVGRVMVHGLHLVAATGFVEETARLWAAVYLHDIAREHDGRCARHGADAWARLAGLPAVQALFVRGGVREEDHPAIAFAVSLHCSGEPSLSDDHYRLAALLKDADALDRVRLSDLKVRMLRHAAARAMVPFAQRLYDRTAGVVRTGPDCFTQLWAVAGRAGFSRPAAE
jgi:hypothetical protein